MKPESDYIRELRRRLAAAEAKRDHAPTLDQLAEARTVVNDSRQGRIVDVLEVEPVGFARGGEFMVYAVTIETNLPLAEKELRAIFHRGIVPAKVELRESVPGELGRARRAERGE